MPSNKIGFKMRQKSVFKKLILSFLCIEAAVLIAVTIIIFRYSRRQEEIDEETRLSQASELLEQVETQLSSAYQLTNSILTDTRLTQVAYDMYSNEYEKSKLVLGILSSINSIHDMIPVVDEIKVYFPNEKLSLSTDNGYDNNDRYVISSDTDIYINNIYSVDNGALKMRLTMPVNAMIYKKVPDYACEVTFKKSFLYSGLTLLSENENGGSIFLLGEDTLTPIYEGESEKNTLVARMILADQNIAYEEKLWLQDDWYTISTYSSTEYPITLLVYQRQEILTSGMMTTILQITAIFLISAVFCLMLIAQTNKNVAQPLYQLMDAFDAVGNRQFDTRIYHKEDDEFHLLFDSFNQMAENTEQLIADIQEQHVLLQNAELMQLQAQIDPHFLYNSFNVIKYMANEEDYDQINEFVSALARYYRFINKETRKMIPLCSEVEHMNNYLYIQQMRFRERISAEVEALPKDVKDFLVPKLILQPLVENIYKHGLKDKLAGGKILVRFYTTERHLIITIEDNGDGLTDKALLELKDRVRQKDDVSVSHALANIRRRLELAYGEKDMLRIERADLGGLRVKLVFRKQND